MTESILAILESRDPLIAVVGASDNPDKFGGRIYRDLKRKGYRIVPVNPARSTVDGDVCYATLRDLPEPPDIVNIVIPPVTAKLVVQECLALGWHNVWLQPGAESQELLEFLEQHGFSYLANACIMVKSRLRAM
jgi:predicted CoA-binding protein